MVDYNVISARMKEELSSRQNWQLPEVMKLFELPFNDLLFMAQTVHRANWDANSVQASTLLSIKTGGCAEDCGYCPQSAKYDTGLKASKLMAVEDVVIAAKNAKANGASRFCMGAAWREPKERDMAAVKEMIREVKALGLETCMTLGMLNDQQADDLSEAGLDYYNHNLDTSPEYYGNIITTRTYQERLDTLQRVANSGMKTCCGGIVGMGEKVEDRAKMLLVLNKLPKHPESVPINMLVQVEGTPLKGVQEVDIFDFIRTIAVARILLPRSYVRLSAGREQMSDETQALCFLAGANSIFYGEKLLTTSNPGKDKDLELLARLGMHVEAQPDALKAAS